MNFEEGDVVMCTVDKIAGTNIFVKIEGGKEGCIVMSEIAPGRIRNIRDYVVPKKKIICKILRISGDRIDLSLRRVTQKEQKEVKERDKQERSYEKILTSILGDKAREIIKTISEEEKVYDFLQDAKENSKKLEKIVGKEDSKRILDILKAQKKKTSILKKEISLTSTKSDGISLIKKILKQIEGFEIRYISAGKYSIKKETEDLKKTDIELKKILADLEKDAKKKGLEVSITKK